MPHGGTRAHENDREGQGLQSRERQRAGGVQLPAPSRSRLRQALFSNRQGSRDPNWRAEARAWSLHIFRPGGTL